MLTATDPRCLDSLRCAKLEWEGGMLNYRLTYSVRVNEGRISRTAKLVLVLFTDQKVLGCVEVEIPALLIKQRNSDRVTGHIDLMPLRDQAASARLRRY